MTFCLDREIIYDLCCCCVTPKIFWYWQCEEEKLRGSFAWIVCSCLPSLSLSHLNTFPTFPKNTCFFHYAKTTIITFTSMFCLIFGNLMTNNRKFWFPLVFCFHNCQIVKLSNCCAFLFLPIFSNTPTHTHTFTRTHAHTHTHLNIHSHLHMFIFKHTLVAKIEKKRQ